MEGSLLGRPGASAGDLGVSAPTGYIFGTAPKRRTGSPFNQEAMGAGRADPGEELELDSGRALSGTLRLALEHATSRF